MSEGGTPKLAYHLILQPTLNGESFILIFEKSVSASRLLSTELRNVYQIGLAVIREGKKDFHFEVENANKEKADETEQ